MDINEELKKYIDKDGKIISYPSKKHRSVRPYIYNYLITKFDNNKEYNETEVNNIIKEWILFDDYCLIRREMVEQGLLFRTKDCRIYKVYEEIDWDIVDKEAEEYLKKCIEVEKQIKEDRKKDKDLAKISKEVDDFAKEHDLDIVYLDSNKDTL